MDGYRKLVYEFGSALNYSNIQVFNYDRKVFQKEETQRWYSFEIEVGIGRIGFNNIV